MKLALILAALGLHGPVGLILVVLLVLLLVGALPTWNHSRSWGYMPGGTLGLLLLVVLLLLLLGVL